MQERRVRDIPVPISQEEAEHLAHLGFPVLSARSLEALADLHSQTRALAAVVERAAMLAAEEMGRAGSDGWPLKPLTDEDMVTSNPRGISVRFDLATYGPPSLQLSSVMDREGWKAGPS